MRQIVRALKFDPQMKSHDAQTTLSQTEHEKPDNSHKARNLFNMQ